MNRVISTYPPPARSVLFRIVQSLALGCGLVAVGLAQNTPTDDFDIATLSLEDLLELKVTSVSRKAEPAFGASAALYTLTTADIQRLGATDLASALRAAPGVQVGRISTTDVALSPRGFNDVSSNKLLALVDGKSIYSPLFGGVSYRHHEMFLPDIERIEVIRGPGGTLWGANAVNGVVNVTTKTAHETLGTLLYAGLGDGTTELSAGLRHGFSVDAHTDARVWVQHRSQAPFRRQQIDHESDLDSTAAGLRIDRKIRDDSSLTLIADYNHSELTSDVTTFSLLPPYRITYPDTPNTADFASVLARWSRSATAATRYELQAWTQYQNSDRLLLGGHYWLTDLEFNLHHDTDGPHDFVAGASYRLHSDEVISSNEYVFPQARSEHQLFTAFVQDEITLVPDRLTVTAGTKVEHNDYTGWEFQPGLRAAWRQDSAWTLWASVARAVRTPGRAERETSIYPQLIPPNGLNPLPTLIELMASPDFDCEQLLAWEAGWRAHLSDTVSLDLAAFINAYDSLRSVTPTGTRLVTTPVPHLVYTQVSGNDIEGTTRGVEALVHWQPTPRWRLQASWSAIDYELSLAPGGVDTTSLLALAGTTARHQFKLFSQLDLGSTWSLDAFVWHQTKLPAAAVPAYTGLNLRLAWHPSRAWEVELIGQDLLDRQHPEFPPTYLGGPTEEIPRSVRLSLTWRH